MIELTGEVGEVIKVGDSIKITVTDTQDNYAKFRITAPKGLNVYRKEDPRTIKDYTSLPYG